MIIFGFRCAPLSEDIDLFEVVGNRRRSLAVLSSSQHKAKLLSLSLFLSPHGTFEVNKI